MPENKKVLVVSYNAIRGIPLGRSVVGNVIVHSGDYGRDAYCRPDSRATIQEQTSAAERVSAQLAQQCHTDLDVIEDAYVYVGASGYDGQIALMEILLGRGKRVRMVACDCLDQDKRSVTERLGVEWIMSECGGEEKLAELVRELA